MRVTPCHVARVIKLQNHFTITTMQLGYSHCRKILLLVKLIFCSCLKLGCSSPFPTLYFTKIHAKKEGSQFRLCTY